MLDGANEEGTTVLGPLLLGVLVEGLGVTEEALTVEDKYIARKRK
jgi:hypothetical protein